MVGADVVTSSTKLFRGDVLLDGFTFHYGRSFRGKQTESATPGVSTGLDHLNRGVGDCIHYKALLRPGRRLHSSSQSTGTVVHLYVQFILSWYCPAEADCEVYVDTWLRRDTVGWRTAVTRIAHSCQW